MRLRFLVSPFFLTRTLLRRSIRDAIGVARPGGTLIDVGCGQKPHRDLFADITAKLQIGAGKTLEMVVAYAKSNPGAKLAISGFHDPSGSQAANEDIAKNRAVAVREALKNVGIAEERVELKKPMATTGSGSPEEARRVEVSVQ